VPEWRIVVTRSFEKDFRSLGSDTRERVLEALQTLQLNPQTGRKLAAAKIGKWRIRTGDYRIRYDIIGNDVVLYRVRHRSRIYQE
jgi:mRNA interferase RelE/StbE